MMICILNKVFKQLYEINAENPRPPLQFLASSSELRGSWGWLGEVSGSQARRRPIDVSHTLHHPAQAPASL